MERVVFVRGVERKKRNAQKGMGERELYGGPLMGGACGFGEGGNEMKT